MDDSGGDGFLAGLLEFATLPDNNSPQPQPQPPSAPRRGRIPTGNAVFRCGFCNAAKYSNQSSIDGHIKDCAQWKGYIAKFWLEAGWTRPQLEHGFTFEDGYPVVKTERICRFCKKVFANHKEVIKHIKSARCTNALAIHDAAPAVRTGQYKCGFCGNGRHFTSDVALDTHIKLCASRHEYTAEYWEEAGWVPGSQYGNGLDFRDGVATVRSRRICQGCYQTLKSLLGLTRHLENGCAGEPEQPGLEPPPLPSPETIAHLALNDIVMPMYRPTAPTPGVRSTEKKQPQKQPRASTTTTSQTPSVTPSRVGLPSTDGARPEVAPTDVIRSAPRSSSVVNCQEQVPRCLNRQIGSEGQRAGGHQQTTALPNLKPSYTTYLQEVINTGPTPEVTELLINLARALPETRAIPSAPLRPRQKRPHESGCSKESAGRPKVEGDSSSRDPAI